MLKPGPDRDEQAFEELRAAMLEHPITLADAMTITRRSESTVYRWIRQIRKEGETVAQLKSDDRYMFAIIN